MKKFNSMIETTSPVTKALTEYTKQVLRNYADSMPDGNLYDWHDCEIKPCLGIVLLAAGHVCPIFRECCLNPLEFGKRGRIYGTLEDGRKIEVALSESSVAGTIRIDPSDIYGSIERYNQHIAYTSYDRCKSDVILAYWEF